MPKIDYSNFDRRREMFEVAITQIPESFFSAGAAWCDRIYCHQSETENHYRAARPNFGDDAWALAYDEAALLAYATHLFGAPLVRVFVDAAADGREHRLLARRMAEQFGAAVVDEIASAIRERATFDASDAPRVPRVVVDNTRDESEFGDHRAAVERAFAALPRDAANAELRPLWEAVRRDSEARAQRRYPEAPADDIASLALREAHVLQALADRFGDEKLANVINAVGEYRKFDPDELYATKCELFGAHRGDEDIQWTVILVLRSLDEIAA